MNSVGEAKKPEYPSDPKEIFAFDKLQNKFFNKNKSFLLDLFYGRLKREYICKNNHIIIIKITTFNTLILPKPNKSNKIIDLLKQYQKK